MARTSSHRKNRSPKAPLKKVTVGEFLPDIVKLCAEAKAASRLLATTSTDQRNRALRAMADAIETNESDILFRNQIDMDAGKRAGLSQSLLDRLELTPPRVAAMARGLREVAELPDPLGEKVASWDRPNGLKIQKVRVPLGVIVMIYESRPNVTVDSTGLCLKSGNAVILRGGREAMDSNTVLTQILKSAVSSVGLPAACVQFVDTTDRSVIRDLVRLDSFVDLAIPRGGEEMVRAVREMATVPVLSHGKGLCAVYVDKDADMEMAERIVVNAKVQRPGVCNAMETLLVHRAIATAFIPRIVKKLSAAGVLLHGDEFTRRLGGGRVRPARNTDWDTEYLSLEAAVRVVETLDEAIGHINLHGSHHSDAIVTENRGSAEQFMARVDSAAVFHNASTRLHDGGALGLGAEMGISTQKLHARGTMGLRELTTTKYVIRGRGQIRD